VPLDRPDDVCGRRLRHRHLLVFRRSVVHPLRCGDVPSRSGRDRLHGLLIRSVRRHLGP
jgi:hypothetical protein